MMMLYCLPSTTSPIVKRAYEREDDFADWSGSESSEGNGYGDNNDDDDWDSYDDDEEEDAAASGSFTDQDHLDYLDGSASYSQEQDGDDLWSDNDNDNYDDMGGDSWDDDSDAPVALRSRKTRAGGALSRRLRPSAWTGDSGRTTGRRSSGGDRGRDRGRSGARGSSAVARYQRSRRPALATRGFAVRMPAVSGAAIASALRRQMGTARDAVEQAGSIAASTSKKLKREVRRSAKRSLGGRGGERARLWLGENALSTPEKCFSKIQRRWVC